MWDKLKEIWSDVYGITATGWIIYHIVMMLIRGKVQIYEPNEWILWVELVFTGGFMVLQIERLIKDCIRRKSNGTL